MTDTVDYGCRKPPMSEELRITAIGHIQSDFPAKFGIPRQSGLAKTRARIVLEGACGNPDVVRGLEQYSHIWLLWGFSETEDAGWSPTVRPPKLGGNLRMGVFATRSPFRPNPIGLSCVRLRQILIREKGVPVLEIEGADLMDGTPIYDIKPYLPYVDCKMEACEGFAGRVKDQKLEVRIPEELRGQIPDGKEESLRQILSLDPRPGYQKDPQRIYGLEYAGMEVHFRVEDGTLMVCQIDFIGKRTRDCEDKGK